MKLVRLCIAMFLLLNPAAAMGMDLVDLAICKDSDFTSGERWCNPGKALPSVGAEIKASEVGNMFCFTKVRTQDVGEVVHVWLFRGRPYLTEPAYYIQGNGYQDSASEVVRALGLENTEAKCMVSAVQLLVRPSPGYRTRSSIAIGPWSTGPWEVRVYNADFKELGRQEFTIR